MIIVRPFVLHAATGACQIPVLTRVKYYIRVAESVLCV